MKETRLTVYANTAERENSLIRNVYLFMAAGLLVTGAVAFFASSSAFLNRFFLMNPFGVIILCVAQLALVFSLSSRVERMSTTSALVTFFAYSALTGLSLSSIFIVYPVALIWKAFVTTALMFGATSIYATVSKKNPASWSRYLMMGLTGLLVAMIFNMIFFSTWLDLAISVLGVVIFTGLTIWDTKRIVSMNREYGAEMTREEHTKLGLIGALDLYLDFLNIFLYLLRIYAAADRD